MTYRERVLAEIKAELAERGPCCPCGADAHYDADGEGRICAGCGRCSMGICPSRPYRTAIRRQLKLYLDRN